MSQRRRSISKQVQRTKVGRAKAQRRRNRLARSGRGVGAAAAAVALAATGGALVAPAHAAPAPVQAPGKAPACGAATTPDSDPNGLTAVGGDLFFTADDGSGKALWTTAGGSGVVKLTGLEGGESYYDYGATVMAAVGDALFFSKDTADGEGEELWTSDGTVAGTTRVKAFPDAGGGYYDRALGGLTAVGDTLFFTLQDDGAESLWSSDGTRAGTVQVAAIDTDTDTGDDDYGYGDDRMVAVGDTVFFTASADDTGAELWTSDGTAAGTALVKDVRAGSYDSYIENLEVLGDQVFFTARDGVHGRELWTSDGTEAGTVLVADLRPEGKESSSPSDLTASGDTLFFAADDGENGRDLWATDGSEAGTTLIKDFEVTDEYDYYGADELTDVAGTLFFAASDGATGQELWTSDGTEAGTVLVEDIRPGAYASYPNALTAAGDTLFFTARDGVTGRELWVSDGTEAGTALVKDVNRNQRYPYPYDLTAVGDSVYYSQDDGRTGRELWVSDGTEAGTALVEDINLGGQVDARLRSNTAREAKVWVFVDGPGTVTLRPQGKRLVKPVSTEFTRESRKAVTLKLTRAGIKQLRKNDSLKISVKLTFKSCSGVTTTETKRFRLR